MSAAIVAAVKAELVAKGVSLVGPCGAYDITRRVAWRLKDSGAGLLDKPSGTNCDGYATDIIAYQDGRIVDCLANAGGLELNGQPIPGTGNDPAWQENAQLVDPSRWRAPHDPDADQVPAPPSHMPPSSEAPPSDALAAFRQNVEAWQLECFIKMDDQQKELLLQMSKIRQLLQDMGTAIVALTPKPVRAGPSPLNTPLPRKKGK